MELLERLRWTTETPAIYVNYYYEYQRDGADMKYRVKIVVEPVKGQSYFGYQINAVVSSEGSQRASVRLKENSPSQWTSNIEWTSDWWTVSNKVSGTSSLSIRLYSNSGGRDVTYNYSMYVAPAYTTVSTWSVASKTETSITLNWATAHTCSQIRYGTSTSSYTTANVNASSGTVTISGLSANTNYTLYFMPCRKDSSLWGDGSANTWKSTTQQTHNYPYATVMPNFNIESSVTITISNPLGRECTVTMLGVDNSVIGSKTTTGTTVSGFDDYTSYIRLYSSIPNSSNGTYKIKVETTQPSSITRTGGTYTALASLSGPQFDNFSFFDDNETTTDLTGNNKYNVNNYSSIVAIIGSQDIAEAQKGATMSKYQFTIGNTTIDIPYSPNLEMSGTIDNASSGEYKVWAIDSRGNSTLVTKYAERSIEYTQIQKGEISIERQDNVGETVTLTFNGTFWGDTFGDITNSITTVTYRYKKTTDETWTTGSTTIVPIESGNNYSFEGSIAGDTAQLGFDAGSSYNIEVTVYDELSSTTFTVTLGSGTPNMAFVENGIALLGKYDENDTTNKLQISGNTKIVGNESVNGDVDITGAYKINGNPLVIPTVNDATLTIQRNGTEVGTFTSNASSNKTINILTPVIYKNTISIIKTSGADASITATVPSGYTFLCWLQPATNGWLGNMYVENPFSQSSKLWCRDGFQSPGGVNCCYLCIKNNS